MSDYIKAELAVNRAKAALIKKAKKTGVYENFGQKELFKLEAMFDASPFGNPEARKIAALISNFEQWSMDYCGER